MELDYEWTCYIFDDAISDCDAEIEGMVSEALEIDPELTDEQKESILEGIDSSIGASYFESCRKSNEEMRRAASDQLSTLEGEKYDLEETVEELENKVTELEGKISELESELIETQIASE